MQKEYILSSIITSGTRRALLELFLKEQNAKYYLRQLERITGEQVNSLNKELHNLTKIGFLKKEKIANSIFYQVNTEFIIYPELKSIFSKIK